MMDVEKITKTSIDHQMDILLEYLIDLVEIYQD